MQIPVANQKTKSIRSPCLDAEIGQPRDQHRYRRRRPPPISSRSRARWTIDLLRTGAETTSTRRRGCEGSDARSPVLRNSCNEGVQTARETGRRAPQPRLQGGTKMGLGVSILLIAAGAILAFAVNTTVSGVDIQTVGWILLVVGIVGAVLSMIFWSTWAGPGYWGGRRRPATSTMRLRPATRPERNPIRSKRPQGRFGVWTTSGGSQGGHERCGVDQGGAGTSRAHARGLPTAPSARGS